MAGIYMGYNLPARLSKVRRKANGNLFAPPWHHNAVRVVPQVSQFALRIAKRPGLPSEIASALWQNGVHIQAFSAELHRGQETLHLAVDNGQVAKKTFIENGWEAAEEDMLA